ncbi:hypothetical protein DL95DRAFT_316618, partial [Leptodontidium sp. 2 PMI_412]
VFRHMLDEDLQTIYFNKYSRKPEWRCRYCGKVYALFKSTSVPRGYLKGFY